MRMPFLISHHRPEVLRWRRIEQKDLALVLKDLIQRARDVSFSPEEIETMVAAYDVARKKLHDRGQPELVNEIIAKRIIALGKTKALDSKEMAARVLASFGLPRED